MMSARFWKRWKKLIAETKAIPAPSPGAENLGKSFEKILKNLDACIEQVEEGEAKSELKKLKGALQGDLDNLRDLTSQVVRLKKLEEDFKSLSKGFRELEAKTSEACGKYFYRQQEYVRAARKAEEQANQQLSRLRAEFLEKVESIAQGYELRVGADASNPEKLYQELMEGSMVSVNLTPKLRGKDLLGVFRGQEDKSRAKKEVLDYLLGETRRKITPILKDREERVAQVKGAYRDLKSLETACSEAEKAREKAEKQIESVRVEILGLRMSKAYAYTKGETLKELKEGYLRKLDEIEGLLEAG